MKGPLGRPNRSGWISNDAHRSLAFPIFLFAEQKEFFLDGLKKLEQRNHKCVEFRGEYVE
jgi:hypothetical protein